MALAKLSGPDFMAAAAADGEGTAAAAAAAAMPRLAPGVTINSTSQKLMAKLERKQQRKLGSSAAAAAAPGAGKYTSLGRLSLLPA
jgi:hypothetical protein